MIKAIVFDFGGVIKEGSFTLSFLKEIQERVKIDEKATIKALRKLVPRFEKGKLDEKEFYEKLSLQLGLKSRLIEKIWKRAHKRLKINPEMIRLINSLKQRGFKVVVLSNTNPPHARTIFKQGYFRIFDTVFLSYKIGMRKPEKQIYKFVLRKLKINPKELVFIDDRARHLKAAKELGIKTILFKNSEQLKTELENFL